MSKRIIIQKGDSLSKIAKQYTDDYMQYLTLANLNNIKNPDLIKEGDTLIIPDKFDKPLTFENIPTRNRISIIDNYSPNYDYIIEGDKIYYSRKGNKNYWVDISDNDVARKNLYSFINDNYNFKGYEDNEKEIYNDIINNNYNYKNRNNRVNNKTLDKIHRSLLKQQDSFNLPRESITIPKNYNTNNSNDNDNIKGAASFFSDLGNYISLGVNGISRWFDKTFLDKDKKAERLSLESIGDIRDSKYNIIPDNIEGKDSIFYGRQYIVPENIDLNNTSLGVRNRGDYKPINSSAGIVTAFSEFKPANNYKNSKDTYLGVDNTGHFKVGKITDFSDNDLVSKTFENEITGFAKDKQGNQIYKNDKSHGNASRSVPVVNVLHNGRIIQGSLNLLTDKNNKGDTYGNVTGGRLIVKAGNETRLISGSINDIEKQIEDIKKRHKSKSVKVYTLDNGSYNRGLRTKDGIMTTEDLKSYDNQNTSGGNFLYIKNQGYPSDTIYTKNVRTKNDESYKKGHSIINQQKGIVLHHTGFMENDLNNVTNHLLKPNGNSAHVIIGYDGKRRILANPNQVTFHAGASRFKGRNNVNDFMIGIEFQGDTDKKPLTQNQINSAIDYMVPIIRKNRISLENITTHQKIREEYNKYNNIKAPNKPDINLKDYERIIKALKSRLYYNK